MNKNWRQIFNNAWSSEKYDLLYNEILRQTGHLVPFRIAESPVFLDNSLWDSLMSDTNDLIDQISTKEVLDHGEKVFKYTNSKVPGDDGHPSFIQFDFGICQNPDGTLQPKLIELQGFPSLYYFQPILADIYKSLFPGGEQLKFYADGIDQDTYYNLLDPIILNGHDPREVIILEIEPEKQNTYIDLLCTSIHLGVKVLCISKVKRSGSKLYYIDDKGVSIPIKRIYNRVIFDELEQRQDIIGSFDMLQNVDVEWAGHPNWFFKLSKFTMPKLKGKSVPKTYFLDQIDYNDLELKNYVLKPLFSFSGAGVEIDITRSMLDDVAQKDHYILQEKVDYVPLVADVNGDLSKFEVRMMAVWPQNHPKPIIANNLIRLSKGKMVGVKYNKDKIWVGGSIGFRE
ncbi:MAG TPA: hypothetical protein PKD85_12115 [Saprospiraceae bacterium]|nr:hypothetical protein [Saprospiraceae bacterium]